MNLYSLSSRKRRMMRNSLKDVLKCGIVIELFFDSVESIRYQSLLKNFFFFIKNYSSRDNKKKFMFLDDSLLICAI